MLEMPYSIVIDATADPEFFGLYSPERQGFTGIGHSVEDCLYQARHGIKAHLQTLREQGMPIPPANPDPKVSIQNKRKRRVA